MARQVLPIAGAVVGGAIGGPMGAQIGFALGSILGNAVDPQVIKGPSLGDANLQTSAEGVFRPIVYGTGAVKGNVIVRGNRQVKTQRTQQGKGGGPVTETQRVYWDFGIRICEGPISSVTRIWQDEKLMYDIRPGSTIMAESADYAERFRLYLGDEDQLPDPDLEAWMGVGNVPAYRGSAWIMFPHFDLTDRRESIPDFRFEVAAAAPPATVSKWLYGPVAQNGPAGGSEAFYRSSDDPSDWSGSTLHASPAWIGTFSRISRAGEAVFLHHASNDAAVSFDRGVTWTQCDSPISNGNNVYWNGRKYWCKNLYSDDGIVWTQIPNSSPSIIYSFADDTGLAVIFWGGNLYSSTDDGATWTNRPTPNNWDLSSHITTDGAKLHMTLNSTRGYFVSPTFSDWTLSLVDGGVASLFEPYTGGSIILRKGFNRIIRSEDAGYNFYNTATFPYGARQDNTIEYGDGKWVIAEMASGSPDTGTMQVSTSGAISGSWVEGDILYGNGANIIFAGGGSSNAGTPTPVLLSSIVSDLHHRANQTTSDYDVSELTDLVYGLVLAGDYTCADAIRTLMPVYFFDASEHDTGTGYRVHYIKRGKPVVRTITFDDLIQAPENTVREDAQERPKKLHLHYENPTIGYAPAKATEIRNSTDILVVGEKSIQVPVSFEDVNEPAQICSKLMKVLWVEVAGETALTVPDKMLDLVPTDCIGLSLRGQVTRQRIAMEQINPGEITWKLLSDRQSAYTSNVTGVPVPEPTPPLPSIVGPTLYAFLDIPALNDNNDRLLWYEGVTGQTPAWYGAQTQHKAGAQVEFENSALFNQNTIMGMLMDSVPSASEHYTDTTNTVRVQLFTDDVIESLTEAQFLSEGGSFALENADGSWEVLQYRDSDDEGDGVFALTYLARGRLNSGATAHLSGSRFVLLDGVQSVDAVTAWINTDIVNRAVSLGTSPDGATQYTNPYEAKSQQEFPVAHLFLDRVGDTINASTVPRHRFGTEDNPVRSINWDGFRWTATDGVNSITVDTNPAASTSFDVTGWASPVTVTVVQLNRFTGAGPTVSEQIA